MIQNSRLAVFLLVPIVAFSCATIVQADELGLAANTPEVGISTRPGGRNFMRLPALRYEFVADTRCSAGLAPGTLSLSIADTRVTRELDIDSGSRIELSVNVPAAQIGPIAVDRFCTADNSGSGQDDRRTLRIPAVLSAQAALLCVSESTSEMTYESESLDVLLRCDIANEPETHSIRR